MEAALKSGLVETASGGISNLVVTLAVTSRGISNLVATLEVTSRGISNHQTSPNRMVATGKHPASLTNMAAVVVATVAK
jgi:hypothetical protein